MRRGAFRLRASAGAHHTRPPSPRMATGAGAQLFPERMEITEGDVLITCASCGETFAWVANEQRWYREHGLMHQPKRCIPCRDTRKAQYELIHMTPREIVRG